MNFFSVSTYLNFSSPAAVPSFDIATIIGKPVQVLIIIFFTVEAFTVLQLEVLQNIGAAIISYLPLLLSALIILGLSFAGGSIFGHYIRNSTGKRCFYYRRFIFLFCLLYFYFLCYNNEHLKKGAISSEMRRQVLHSRNGSKRRNAVPPRYCPNTGRSAENHSSHLRNKSTCFIC